MSVPGFPAILSLPPGMKCEFMGSLVAAGYRGAVIIEKPLSLCRERAEKIAGLCLGNGLRAGVAFSRDFMKMPDFRVLPGEDVVVSWPYPELKIDPFVHQGAHLLHFALKFFCGEQTRTEMVRKGGGTLEVIVRSGSRRIVMRLFPETAALRRQTVNGVLLPEVNHLTINPEMVSRVLDWSQADTERSLALASRTTVLHEEILKWN